MARPARCFNSRAPLWMVKRRPCIRRCWPATSGTSRQNGGGGRGIDGGGGNGIEGAGGNGTSGGGGSCGGGRNSGRDGRPSDTPTGTVTWTGGGMSSGGGGGTSNGAGGRSSVLNGQGNPLLWTGSACCSCSFWLSDSSLLGPVAAA